MNTGNENEKKVLNGSFSYGKPSFVFAHTKSEKLASAIYMVTSSIPDNEPLKWTLRKECLKLISKMSLINKGIGKKDLMGVVFEMVSLLDVAHTAGYVSLMNLNVLRDEYNKLASFIHERGDSFLNESNISQNFFKTDIAQYELQKEEQITEAFKTVKSSSEYISSELSDNTELLKSTSPQSNMRASGLKDKTSFKGTGSQKVEKSPIVAERKGSRRDSILGLLKKQKKITVKDVAGVVTNCSEKTIQRELLSLVKEGVLRREGERRWSTYFLA